MESSLSYLSRSSLRLIMGTIIANPQKPTTNTMRLIFRKQTVKCP